MDLEIPVDEHYGIGPYTDVYDHGPVTTFVDPPYDEDGARFFACLDCGYLAHDIRLFLHEDCDSDQNGINTMWRDVLGDDAFDFGDD